MGSVSAVWSGIQRQERKDDTGSGKLIKRDTYVTRFQMMPKGNQSNSAHR